MGLFGPTFYGPEYFGPAYWGRTAVVPVVSTPMVGDPYAKDREDDENELFDIVAAAMPSIIRHFRRRA